MRDQRFIYKTHYGESYALVIGVDKYQVASPLSYAVSDATAIRDLLIADLGFPEANVTLLTDTSATKQAVLKAFLRFAKGDIGLDDRLIFFFAGHGHTRTGSRGEVGYLVPHDADTSDPSTFIRWDELTGNADLIRAKHLLFIMDACYGGLALVRTAVAGSTRFLKDMLLRSSRQVLTAGKADEVVSDSGGPIPDHSVFTGHLIEALRGKAATADGILTASAAMAYVYTKVANDKGSQQTPHYGHIDGDGDMILIAPGLGALQANETEDIDWLISIPYAEPTVEIDSTAAKIRRVKSLLSSDSGSIELHDMLTTEVRRFLSLTGEDSFSISESYDDGKFLLRLERYEQAAKDVSLLLACLAQWGRPAHLGTLQKCIARSSDRLESKGGTMVWLALRWYPLIIELYCCGVAAVDARRFDALASIFYASTPSSEYQTTSNVLIGSISDAILQLNQTNVLQHIPGYERRHTPLSDYLLKELQPMLDDTLFLGKNYEFAFETFEVYLALCAADLRLQTDKHVWAPLGRFAWRRGHGNSPLERVLKEAEAQKADWPPIKAGLFGGDIGRFNDVAAKFSQFMGGLRWG